MVLRPLSWIYAAATARRIAGTAPFDPAIPVISVGNLTVGGSGKTPVARELLRLLRAAGVDAHALSRGTVDASPARCAWTSPATPPSRSATSPCC
jgi:tetraacyldisaccharide 4'-kinase